MRKQEAWGPIRRDAGFGPDNDKEKSRGTPELISVYFEDKGTRANFISNTNAHGGAIREDEGSPCETGPIQDRENEEKRKKLRAPMSRKCCNEVID